MQIDWLYSFLETSRQKSLSKASEVLVITQPALSKQIRRLEENLGVQVFKRTTSGVELTAEGQLLQERIQPLLHELDSLKKDLLNLNQLNSVRLGALPSLAAFYLPEKVTSMNRQGITSEMKVFSTSSEVISSLQSGALDAGLVQNTTPIPQVYWSIDLFSEPFMVVVNSSHPFFERESLTLPELQTEPLIVYPRQCDVRHCIVHAFAAIRSTPNLAVEVSFGESIPGFVAAGAGISILPKIMAKQVFSRGLKAIPIDDFSISRTISLVSPKPAVGKKLRSFLS